MIIAGIVVILAALWFGAEKKLTVDLVAVWGIFGIILISAGAVSPFGEWIRNMIWRPETGRFIFCIVLLIAGFFASVRFSELKMKNQELAIRVSLLLQENERILSETNERAQKDSVCCQHDGARRSGDGSGGAFETD